MAWCTLPVCLCTYRSAVSAAYILMQCVLQCVRECMPIYLPACRPACRRAYVRACMRAYLRVCMRVHVHERACIHAYALSLVCRIAMYPDVAAVVFSRSGCSCHNSCGLHGSGIYSHGPCSHGLYIYGLYIYGPCSYGFYIYRGACAVMAYIVMAAVLFSRLI